MQVCIERFLKYVNKKESSCWEWIGSIQTKTGYGQFYLNKKNISSHRVSWILHEGEIPKGLCVLHKCDNRKCVNPDHLWIGNHKENTRDMIEKGRIFIQKSIMNDQQKSQCIQLYKKGIKKKEIASILGVNQKRVWKEVHKYFPHFRCIGTDNKKSKLTEIDVLEIRKSYIPYKMSCPMLAKKFSVNTTTIQRIIFRQTWKHI